VQQAVHDLVDRAVPAERDHQVDVLRLCGPPGEVGAGFCSLLLTLAG
jgi:hypothetical protein